jgi:hypothetical protein
MPSEAIDTSKTIEIAHSGAKMLLLVLAAAAMTAGSAFLAFEGARRDPAGFRTFIGYVGVAFFGLCFAVGLWRALTARGPVLTLSPRGLRDARVSHDPIPWSSIRNLSTWSHRGQKILVVAVDPEVEASIGLTAMARWTRAPNRALGVDGLSISAQGLKINYDRLLELVRAYAQSHHLRRGLRDAEPSTR